MTEQQIRDTIFYYWDSGCPLEAMAQRLRMTPAQAAWLVLWVHGFCLKPPPVLDHLMWRHQGDRLG